MNFEIITFYTTLGKCLSLFGFYLLGVIMYGTDNVIR